MPTPELPIRSSRHKVVFVRTMNFTDTVNEVVQRFAERSWRYGQVNSIHYRFINEQLFYEMNGFKLTEQMKSFDGVTEVMYEKGLSHAD